MCVTFITKEKIVELYYCFHIRSKLRSLPTCAPCCHGYPFLGQVCMNGVLSQLPKLAKACCHRACLDPPL